MTKAKTDPVETPPVDAPPPAETPTTPAAPVSAPVLERPRAGGSYIRQRDGSLVKREG